MPVHGEWIRFRDQTGYFAYPAFATKPLPSILVIQEVWGVESQIIDTTQRLAAAGYAAYAPDLFAKGGTRPAALTDERIAQVQEFTATVPPAAWGDAVAGMRRLISFPSPEGQKSSKPSPRSSRFLVRCHSTSTPFGKR